MRRQRYWLCERCGLIWHRQKGGQPSKHCGVWLKAIRTYNPKRIAAIKARHARKVTAAYKQVGILERRHARPLTACGYRLRISKDTKAAWKSLERYARRDSFLRRGQKFLDALGEDIWTCPHQHGGRARVNCHCPGGGWYSVPTLTFNDRLGIFTLGKWRRSVRLGHTIEINGSRAIYLPHWLGTLIHEATHWSDATSYNRANPSRSVDRLAHVGPHSPAFKSRMGYLAKALGYKGALDDDDD